MRAGHISVSGVEVTPAPETNPTNLTNYPKSLDVGGFVTFCEELQRLMPKSAQILITVARCLDRERAP